MKGEDIVGVIIIIVREQKWSDQLLDQLNQSIFT